MALTLTIGQKAVYPSRGIAEVVGIERKEIGGKAQEFYVLRLSSSDLKILVHVDKAEQVGLRPVAGKADAEVNSESMQGCKKVFGRGNSCRTVSQCCCQPHLHWD